MDKNNFQMKCVIDEKYEGLPLRDFLMKELQFSARILKKVKTSGGKLCINGKKQTVRYILKQGDDLFISFPPEKKSASVKLEKMDLSILYEDEYLLIVDKVAGIPTIPSRLHPRGTLANGIAYYYKENNIPYTLHVVTRLDKDTSGLVLIAKHQYCHSLLSSLLKENKIKRTYRAIVHGTFMKKSGMIDAPIGRHPDSIIERMVTENGKRAITYYKVLEETEKYSELEIRLQTGRTHQIRVHLSYLGHPLVGDELYGGKKGKINRQALHCSEIKFTHPFNKENIHIVSELPNDMVNVINEKRTKT